MLRLEAHIARCQLLVVDELGYLPLDKLIEGDRYRLQASLKAKNGGGVPKTPRT